MDARVERAGLQVQGVLARFIEEEALPGTGIDAAPSGRGSRAFCAISPRGTGRFWHGARNCRQDRRLAPGAARAGA